VDLISKLIEPGSDLYYKEGERNQVFFFYYLVLILVLKIILIC
jgi:hypothetical protein